MLKKAGFLQSCAQPFLRGQNKAPLLPRAAGPLKGWHRAMQPVWGCLPVPNRALQGLKLPWWPAMGQTCRILSEDCCEDLLGFVSTSLSLDLGGQHVEPFRSAF